MNIDFNQKSTQRGRRQGRGKKVKLIKNFYYNIDVIFEYF